MEEIRVMWCDVLEELLQCPVCLEATQGVKVQCVNGHHICNACRVQLHVCPICKSAFIGTRNLAVEQISAKLQDIKLSLLHPYHALNRRVLHDKICAATQTDYICMPSTASQTESVNQATPIIPRNEQQRSILSLAPRVGKGSYPCRIGSCITELPHGRMIGHLRYHHKDVFFEFNASKDNVVRRKWDLDYILDRDYDFAFHIKEMGLFFLNISINRMGDLMAFLQIVNCIAVCKQFTYIFEVIGEFNASYNGQVKSCRASRQCLSNDRLRIREDNMRHLIDHKNSFHCNLTIKRRVDYRTIAAQNNPTNARDDIMNN
ncbi:SINAL ligase, partial [Acromyrmex insinuator]